MWNDRNGMLRCDVMYRMSFMNDAVMRWSIAEASMDLPASPVDASMRLYRSINNNDDDDDDVVKIADDDDDDDDD